jgi:hypothetical protein
MIKRPTSAREWKTDQTRLSDRDRMEQERANAVERSVESLKDKLKVLVKQRHHEQSA